MLAVSHRPFMIGIAGGSSSGKTTVTERLVQMTGADHLSLIELDSYYLDLGDTPIEQRRTVNYDHPNAFDWALLNDHLAALANNELGASDRYVRWYLRARHWVVPHHSFHYGGWI